MNEQEIINEVIDNLKIDNPCPMLLARLKEDNDSYFCNSCKKEIIDFRNCSKEEIATKMLSSNNICGIFYEDQLGMQHQVRYSFFQNLAFYFLVICSSIGLNVTPLNAQSKNKITTEKYPAAILQPKEEKTKIGAQDLPNTTPIETPKEEVKKEPVTKRRRKGRIFRRRVMGCPAW